MTKTLKDWPSNCEADFFDALPEAGSKTFFDFTKPINTLYYVRFHDPVTHETHVIPETHLGGFLKSLEKDFKTFIPGPFLGFHDDLEQIFWWPQGDDEKPPVPQGIVGVTEKHTEWDLFERATIVFYEIQKAPRGWVFSSEPGHFQVKPIRQWIFDYTEPDHETDADMSEECSDLETDPDMPDLSGHEPAESVYNYLNPVFGG